MKILFCVLFVFIIQYSFSQKDTLIINGFKFFTEKQVLRNEFGTKDTVLKFYRIENGKQKYLLKHNLYAFSADCNNEFKDIGSYTVKHDSIVFVTNYFQKTGMDPIPDTRMQIFKVQPDGKLKEIFDKELQRYTGEWLETQK